MEEQEKQTKLAELLKGVDSLMSKIPGNGNKTAIGAAILAAMPHLAEAFPVLLTVTPYLNMVGLLLTVGGMVHKGIKFSRMSMFKPHMDGVPGAKQARED